MRNAPFGPKPIFFQWTINIFDEKSILFQWAVLSWSLGGLGAVLGWSWADEGSMKDRWRDQWRVDEGSMKGSMTVSYTHLRAHETLRHLVCRLLLEKKNKQRKKTKTQRINRILKIVQLPIALPRRLLCYYLLFLMYLLFLFLLSFFVVFVMFFLICL